MNSEELISRIETAFKNYKENPCSLEHGECIVSILDAIEDNMTHMVTECGYGTSIPHQFNENGDILSLLHSKSVMDCFTDGWNSYNYNPFDEDKKDRFRWNSKYVTLDAYEHIVGIDDRIDLACWYNYRGFIYDYIIGNYGKPSEDAISALENALK